MMKYPATLICVLFILYLFWKDRKKGDEGPSNAIWIPFAWMFFCGSRYVAGWLSLAGLNLGATTSDEGNPVNAASFFLLIIAGVFVLSRRKVDWGTVLTQNKWIWLYFLYCGVSIAWSDYSFIALKRWIKELGNPIMVLVILTEKHPYQALGVILRRLAFLWLPISVLFIKYYPAWGREYSPGGMSWGGISGEKNSLGMICLISGIYFSWNFLLNQKKGSKVRERASINDIILVGMVAWLLYMSHSATSLACLVVAVGLLIISRTTFMAQNPGRIIALMMVTASLYFVLDATLGISDIVIGALGRDATLTSRTSIWKIVEEFHTNPILGTGYQSFWAGDRLPILWANVGVGINQAHNGYLEQYLHLGYVGVAFIGIIMLSGLLKVRRCLNVDYPAAILRLCFIVTAVLYNYTEASFYGLNNMWLLTLFAIIEISSQQGRESADSRRS
jgi:O-antigen ligase